MPLKSCTTEDVNRRKLEVEVPADEFAKAVGNAYRKNVAKMNIPGFRKGKAPRSIIERMYGKEFFYEDAVNALYPAALEAAVKEGGLKYIDDEIDLDVVSVGEEGLVFTAVITVEPEVSLGDYKKIKVTKPETNVTDDDVTAEIDAVRERNARTVSVDGRPAQDGDTAVFDFEGFVDGEPFEGGASEDYKLVLGSGNFIPGFEEQMIGHSPGEEFEVGVDFPEDYHAEELAGKPAVFKIKLHELKTKELPELDDEFAKDVSEFDTLDEYKADIMSNLEKKAGEKAEAEIDNQIADALVDMLEGDVPEAMYKNRVDDNLREFAYRLQAQGIGFEDYLHYTGANVDDIRSQMRGEAEKQVKLRLALEKIVELEEISISDEELEEEYKKIADGHEMEIEAVKKAVSPEDLSADLKTQKAMSLARDLAKIS